MKNHRFLFSLLVSTLTFSCTNTSTQYPPPKHIIGAVELVQVEGLEYRARIDTGADITSIHAYDITIENEEENLNANIGKQLYFKTANEKGETKLIEAKIVNVNTVRNALGKESRYVVQLAIAWGDYVKTVDVNLKNRTNMQFALLIGRNWLKDDFIVDVSDEEDQMQEKNSLIEKLLPNILTH
jgi:hypothetical protein